MKKFLKYICIVLSFACTIFFSECALISSKFPKVFNITDYSEITLSTNIPIKIESPHNSRSSTPSISKDPAQVIKGKLTLLDIFPIKTIEMHLTDEKNVNPCGTPFGVKLFENGPMVINVSEVRTELGCSSPAEESGIKKSDIITHLDGNQIKTNESLAELIEKSDGRTIKLSVLREKKAIEINVTPVKCIDDKKYKIGIWVRDSSGGIGTLTFYDPKSEVFSGLGHGICDVDTGDLLPLEHGDIMDATINGITRGKQGRPGELKGSFVGTKPIGKLTSNIETGIYGKLNCLPAPSSPIKVAMKQQVKTGYAKVLTTISGKTPKYYDINIESINYNENNPTKNILISITDEELLEKTGGIIQGMSGSPIIQNGMLVGAVTHVFINEPKRGYAIFSETMLNESRDVFGLINKIYR